MSSGCNFVVLEHLPWLEHPRVIGHFKDLKEAELEAQRLNSKSPDSNYSVVQVEFGSHIGLAISSKEIEILKKITTYLRF
jgi:hypothetical protein